MKLLRFALRVLTPAGSLFGRYTCAATTDVVNRIGGCNPDVIKRDKPIDESVSQISGRYGRKLGTAWVGGWSDMTVHGHWNFLRVTQSISPRVSG